MINNYLEDEVYHQSDHIYRHQYYKTSLYIGDMSSALDITSLVRNNVKTVITAASGMDHIEYQPQLQIYHKIYPLLDIKSENIGKLFNPIHQFIEDALKLGSVLVHCAAGISRSATLVIAYLMKHQHWNFRQTITFVRKNRPAVCPNLGFQRQLKEYEQIVSKPSSKNIQRKKPKTSQQAKHGSKKEHYELPEIGSLGRTQIRSIVFDPVIDNNSKRNSHRGRISERDNKNTDELFPNRLKPLRVRKAKSLAQKQEMKTQRQKKTPTLSLGVHSVFIQKIQTPDIEMDRLGRRRALVRFPKNYNLM